MKQILKLAAALFLITAVTAAALSAVNRLTEDRIAAAREEKNRQAMAQVLPQARELSGIPFTDTSGLVRQVFAPGGDPGSGQFAVTVAPAGFGGELTMMVGISQGVVTGISIVSHSETPSLGAVAAADSSKGVAFREQFAGMEGPLAVGKDGGQIDAITGATVTSRAVCQGAQAALDCAAALS